MKPITATRWFFGVELACLTMASGLWLAVPGLSWQPLVLAVLPLGLRLAAGRSPLARTPFDLAVVVFLVTAGVGVWAAYQPQTAWLKFWLLLAAVLVYYTLARQPEGRLWPAAAFLGVAGLAILTIAFLSSHLPGPLKDFPLLDQLGLPWLAIPQEGFLKGVHPSDLAETNSLIVPFAIALGVRAWRKGARFTAGLWGALAGLSGLSLLVSRSASALVAIAITLGLWLVWGAAGWAARRLGLARGKLYGGAVVLLAGLAAGAAFIYINSKGDELVIEANSPTKLDQRLHLQISALALIEEMPFTGGGLGGFPGHYSAYILINPRFKMGTSHNLFLDAALEQGVAGGLALAWIYLGAILLLAWQPVPEGQGLLRGAVLSSLAISTIHGVADPLVYSTLFAPLLLFVPGMAAGLARAASGRVAAAPGRAGRSRLGLIILVGLGLLFFYRPLLSAWHSNRGVVAMAGVELADFPAGEWDSGAQAGELAPAAALFREALALDPANASAHYRLGRIALLERDFPRAIGHLETAYLYDPDQRGIIKALGYSYLWNGQVEEAMRRLARLPETDYEVGNYIDWWRGQGRPDLAAYAQEYLERSGGGE